MSKRYKNLTIIILSISFKKITQQGKNSKNVEEEKRIVLESFVFMKQDPIRGAED